MRKPSRKPEPPLVNLPASPSSFVGRQHELKKLAQLYRGSSPRVVTLVGPPGIGKTRLALEFTQRAAPAPGYWVPLESARESEQLCSSIAQVLGAPMAGTGGAVERLGQFLAERGPLLLLLDNLEQVIEAAAFAVATWCDMASRVRFLITSREALRIDGERTLQVQPLEVPIADGLTAADARQTDSVTLLLDRAPSFELADDTAPVVAQLLQELDGVPLAIELAAARLPVLGPAEMYARMHQRLDLLSRGKRAAVHRQATLRTTLDWSWDLLSPLEQTALCTASLFSGGFSLAAFEAAIPAELRTDALDLNSGVAGKVAAALGLRQPRQHALHLVQVDSRLRSRATQGAIRCQRHAPASCRVLRHGRRRAGAPGCQPRRRSRAVVARGGTGEHPGGSERYRQRPRGRTNCWQRGHRRVVAAGSRTVAVPPRPPCAAV